jgi:hypothetical protein
MPRRVWLSVEAIEKVLKQRRRTMNVGKVFAALFCFILAIAVFLPPAGADEWNQMTKLSFTEPIEIPGAVLPAGTYWFVLLDDAADRDIVQIFNEDWTQLYATVITIPTYRHEPTDKTEIKFAERPHQDPEALLKWYYPGFLTGHEFLYPKKEEAELARDVKLDVLAQPLNVASNIIPGA